MRTLSDVRDGFLPRLPGVSLSGLVLVVQFLASCTPPDRILLDHLVPLRFTRSLVLSVASCNVTSFTASCVRISSHPSQPHAVSRAASGFGVHSHPLRALHVTVFVFDSMSPALSHKLNHPSDQPWFGCL